MKDSDRAFVRARVYGVRQMRTQTPRFLASCGAALLTVGGVAAQEGGIEIFAGETLFQAGTRLSVTEIYKHKGHLWDGSSRVSDPLNRTFEEWRTVFGLDYGVLPDMTVSALVPMVYRSQRQTGPDVSAFGLGDIALIGKYRLYDRQWKAGSFAWAGVGGIEMPTGETNAKENGLRLPPSLQPGTGSWNPFLATAVTYDQGRFRSDGVFFYKFNGNGAQNLNKGDFLFLSARASYRFIMEKYPGPTVAGIVGLDYRHLSRDYVSGQLDLDSGSDQLHAVFAINSHPTPALDLGLQVEVPLYQTFHGQQLGRDVVLALRFGFRF